MQKVTQKVVEDIVKIKDYISLINTCVAGVSLRKKVDALVMLNILKSLKAVKKLLDQLENNKKTKEDFKMIKTIKKELNENILSLDVIKQYEGGDFIINYYYNFKKEI